MKILLLFIINNNLAQPTATLLVGFFVTLFVNHQQLKISQENRKQDLEISEANRKQELIIAQENNEEEILQKYLDSMEKLLLNNNLDDFCENNQARNVARFKTLTVLRRLILKPQLHKNIILKFLYDAKLIIVSDGRYKHSKLSLVSCDFQEADLIRIFLNKADLAGTYLRQANLTQAKLEGASLIQADLVEAKLIATNLTGATLSKAFLNRADLTGADLTGADLTGADLTGADLTGADLTQVALMGAYLGDTNLMGANLTQANLEEVYFSETNLEGVYLYQTECLDIKQLKLVKNWEKAIYTEAEFDGFKLKWIPKDKKANEAKIQEIKDSTQGIVQF